MLRDHHIKYQPLSTDEKQIRTLILRAGKVADPIQCALHIVSLADEPYYEALSYTWGDASVTEPIEVEGVLFNATRNLERALRHLRDTNSDLTLWVDAGESTMYCAAWNDKARVNRCSGLQCASIRTISKRSLGK
jgi:hypothetical protein